MPKILDGTTVVVSVYLVIAIFANARGLMKRITWVDNFKFFCIIAVMAEHTKMLTGLTDSLNATFYVSGFFFASGYLYKHADGYAAFLKKKTVQLLIPWFVFSMFIVISSRVLTFGSNDTSLGRAILDNLIQKRYCGDEMWFVAALFVCFLPLYFLIKWIEKNDSNKKKKILVSIAILLVLSVFDYLLSDTEVIGGEWHQYPWHLEYIFRGLFLMLLGYVFRHYLEDKFDKINTPVFLVIIFVVLFGITWGTQLANHVFNPIDAALFKYVSSFVGISAFIALSKKVKYNRYMSFVGRNTVTYYGLHGKVESLIHHVLVVYVRDPYWALCWSFTDSTALLFEATACTYLIALAVSVILIIPVWLVDKYLPFATGKGFKKKF